MFAIHHVSRIAKGHSGIGLTRLGAAVYSVSIYRVIRIVLLCFMFGELVLVKMAVNKRRDDNSGMREGALESFPGPKYRPLLAHLKITVKTTEIYAYMYIIAIVRM